MSEANEQERLGVVRNRAGPLLRRMEVRSKAITDDLNAKYDLIDIYGERCDECLDQGGIILQ